MSKQKSLEENQIDLQSAFIKQENESHYIDVRFKINDESKIDEVIGILMKNMSSNIEVKTAPIIPGAELDKIWFNGFDPETSFEQRKEQVINDFTNMVESLSMSMTT